MATETAPAGELPWHVEGLPAFQDNYLWVLHNTVQAIVVDPGDAAVVDAFLQARRLRLAAILCTHHHADHVGGVATLLARYPEAQVLGPDDDRIPHLGRAVTHGDVVTLPAGPFTVIGVEGHTRTHIAWCWRDRLFCGDALFALGCGRLFEGTAADLQRSLARLSALPGDWWVHCAHEYTLANLAFALQVDGTNPALQARAQRERARRQVGRPTVPSRLSDERATNPFLRPDDPAVRAAAAAWAGHPLADAVAVTGALREWKNQA